MEVKYMRIYDKLINIQLPKVYKREGKDCYFDIYRKRLIEITPEETVRQKVARYFEVILGVSKEFMFLEVPMSYYVKGLKGRADIIIHQCEEDGIMKPVAAGFGQTKEDYPGKAFTLYYGNTYK